MNPWFDKAVILAGSIVMVVIRAPHWRQSLGIKVVESRKGRQEFFVRPLAGLAFFILLLWLATPVFIFADYPLRPGFYAVGIFCSALGLWLFHRSHADFGMNWSITLELREKHQLVTQGVYRRIRHRSYTSREPTAQSPGAVPVRTIAALVGESLRTQEPPSRGP